MLLQKLCRKISNIQLRQCSTPPKFNEPLPQVLSSATEQWQKRHMTEMKKLLAEKRISDALTYFYREVKTPSLNHFSVLVSAVGKTGHTDLAFKLLREMRVQRFKPTPAILTSLFNSCANNDEEPKLALAQANSLYTQMHMKGWHGSHITYHSMIKAFAMHGDTETCFKLMDEMQEKRLLVSTDTYTHLMMACIGDKKLGFVLALRVMRSMLWNRIKPSVHSYNTLLRAAVDCGCGDNVEVMNKLLNDAKRTQLKDPRLQLITAEPSLLNTRLSESLVSIARVPESLEDKLALIGGWRGVFKNLEYFGVRPNPATYSLLLPCITKEDEFLEFWKTVRFKDVDIVFFNQALKKCIVAKWECAHHVEKALFISKKQFDILTHGVLAMRVNTPEKVEIFMSRMERHGITPNEVIMSTLLNNLSRNFKPNAILKVLQFCISNDIALNKTAIKSIAMMLDVTRLKDCNASIEAALKKVRVAGDQSVSRFQQFVPAVLKRNKRRWDPEAEDEDVEERDRELEKEAGEQKALVARRRKRHLAKHAT